MTRDWADELALLQEVYSAGNLVGFLVNRELEADGISPRLYSFLGWVHLLGPVTPGRLGEESGMPATTIRDYVRELIERGDVRKAPNPDDGRSYLLELTPKGRALTERGMPALARAFGQLEPRLKRPAGDYIAMTVELRVALRETLEAG
jgi:DNA-binding MarR family transcriptional regulator